MHSELNDNLIKSETELQRLVNERENNLTSRASNMLHNKSFTDVSFIVGPPSQSKKYVGHRVLLAMTSPVFEAMFYGEMADKSKVIRIPDLAPIGFENLLRYAYTDSLNLNNVEDAMLTAYAAKKYLLPHLLRECLSYIDKNITPNTACAVYEFSITINSYQLMFQSLQIIDKHTYNIITQRSFNSIQPSTIELIINRKYLNLSSEYSLATAIIHWAIAEAKRRQYNYNDWIVIRTILQENNIIKFIRFLSMTNEEFCRLVAQTTSNLSNMLGAPNSNPNNLSIDKQDEQLSSPSASGQMLGVMLSDNSLLSKLEQISLFMNLIIPGITLTPKGLSSETNSRKLPSDFYIVQRYKPTGYSTISNFAISETSKFRCVSSRFQVHNSNVFIIGAIIPIRLDPVYYSLKTPKLDCQLRFSSKNTSESITGRNDENVILDTIDDSISLVICKEKDCVIRLKRPIFVKKHHYNELTLTFPPSSLFNDIVLIKGNRVKALQNEILDNENLTWMFFKTNNTEFSELYYYY